MNDRNNPPPTTYRTNIPEPEFSTAKIRCFNYINRFPKEWGDEHEAEAVMHLRTPILSAAVAMGLGGITTVHQVSLSEIYLDGEVRPQPPCNYCRRFSAISSVFLSCWSDGRCCLFCPLAACLRRAFSCSFGILTSDPAYHEIWIC